MWIILPLHILGFNKVFALMTEASFILSFQKEKTECLQNDIDIQKHGHNDTFIVAQNSTEYKGIYLMTQHISI